MAIIAPEQQDVDLGRSRIQPADTYAPVRPVYDDSNAQALANSLSKLGVKFNEIDEENYQNDLKKKDQYVAQVYNTMNDKATEADVNNIASPLHPKARAAVQEAYGERIGQDWIIGKLETPPEGVDASPEKTKEWLDGIRKEAFERFGSQPFLGGGALREVNRYIVAKQNGISLERSKAWDKEVDNNMENRFYHGGNNGSYNTAAAPTPEKAKAIVDAANELGVDAKDLAMVISYESGFSEKRWGGKGGQYFGLIQFGPAERKQFGVYEGQSFEEQMKAVVAFLKARGVKPGMGLVQLYKTVNGGNPYVPGSRSDGNGTIDQHVARIQNSHQRRAMGFLGAIATGGTQTAGGAGGTKVAAIPGTTANDGTPAPATPAPGSTQTPAPATTQTAPAPASGDFDPSTIPYPPKNSTNGRTNWPIGTPWKGSKDTFIIGYGEDGVPITGNQAALDDAIAKYRKENPGAGKPAKTDPATTGTVTKDAKVDPKAPTAPQPTPEPPNRDTPMGKEQGGDIPAPKDLDGMRPEDQTWVMQQRQVFHLTDEEFYKKSWFERSKIRDAAARAYGRKAIDTGDARWLKVLPEELKTEEIRATYQKIEEHIRTQAKAAQAEKRAEIKFQREEATRKAEQEANQMLLEGKQPDGAKLMEWNSINPDIVKGYNERRQQIANGMLNPQEEQAKYQQAEQEMLEMASRGEDVSKYDLSKVQDPAKRQQLFEKREELRKTGGELAHPFYKDTWDDEIVSLYGKIGPMGQKTVDDPRGPKIRRAFTANLQDQIAEFMQQNGGKPPATMRQRTEVYEKALDLTKRQYPPRPERDPDAPKKPKATDTAPAPEKKATPKFGFGG